MALETTSIDQTSCCGNHGICSHQILQDECPGPNRKADDKIVARKVSFRARVSLTFIVNLSDYGISKCAFCFCNMGH